MSTVNYPMLDSPATLGFDYIGNTRWSEDIAVLQLETPSRTKHIISESRLFSPGSQQRNLEHWYGLDTKVQTLGVTLHRRSVVCMLDPRYHSDPLSVRLGLELKYIQEYLQRVSTPCC
jgi:hypothetical protein